MYTTQRTVVHFVRHGAVENPKQVRYGRMPGFHLNVDGRRQIEQAAAYLVGRPIRVVYASPMERTQQSATILGMAFPHAPIHLDSRLLEIKTASRFEGHARKIAFSYPLHDSQDAETANSVVTRLRHFVEDMVVRHAGSECLAVSHGDPIALLTNYLLYGKVDPNHPSYPGFGTVRSFVFQGASLQEVLEYQPVSAGSIRNQ